MLFYKFQFQSDGFLGAHLEMAFRVFLYPCRVFEKYGHHHLIAALVTQEISVSKNEIHNKNSTK
jgi:hypothetical protein